MVDKLIKRFDSVRDNDLAICEKRGVAYQAVGGRVGYGADYFSKVQAYEGTPTAKAANAGRVAMLERQIAPGASVLDWGAGTGAFVKAAAASGFAAKGWDVNPVARIKLTELGVVDGDPYRFDAVTMWDTIEHMEQPGEVFKSIKKGGHFFASLPIFDDLKKIRESKHYRPGEHLHYWTDAGFVDWMALWGFRLLERSGHEVDVGRESIGAYAFRRDLPDYHDHIAAYREMHLTKHYGDSATELYLDLATEIVKKRAPRSILDFGCGRSDLAAHFWLDGARKIGRYDPAIGRYEMLPEGKFDLVLCLDVMEHIPMRDVDKIFYELKSKGDVVLFSISTKLARAKLPDGRNAHVTILTKDEWLRWVKDVFYNLRLLPSKYEEELVILTGGA